MNSCLGLSKCFLSILHWITHLIPHPWRYMIYSQQTSASHKVSLSYLKLSSFSDNMPLETDYIAPCLKPSGKISQPCSDVHSTVQFLLRLSHFPSLPLSSVVVDTPDCHPSFSSRQLWRICWVYSWMRRCHSWGYPGWSSEWVASLVQLVAGISWERCRWDWMHPSGCLHHSAKGLQLSVHNIESVERNKEEQ